MATEHLKWVKVAGELNFKYYLILMNLNVNRHVAMAIAMESASLNILLYFLPFCFF